jgi:hypothetical protein
MGKFILGKKHDEKAFEVLLLDHSALAKNYDISIIKPTTMD